MVLNSFDYQAGSSEIFCILLHRLGIAQAGNPGQQTVKLSRKAAGAGNIAQAQSPAGTQYSRKFYSRGVLIRKCTKGALADQSIEIPIAERQRFGVAQKELLRQFEKTENRGQTSPQSEGFLKKVKELWEDLKE